MSEPNKLASGNFDAVVVGGGVTGAIAALRLAQAGKRVLILEAGTDGALNPETYRSYLSKYYAMGSLRSTPNGPYPANQAAPSPGANDGSSYFVQDGPRNFMSDYLRMLAGSTLHWQGTSLRMLPNDFRMKSQYGHGVDWPITYDLLEPDYRVAERVLGVSADVEDQKNFGVWFPDDYVYPMHRMPQSMVDNFFSDALTGRQVTIQGADYPLRVVSIPMARNAVPNLRFDGGSGYDPVGAIGNRDEGNRCQGNSSCLPLCPVQAKYNALKTLAQAVATGNVVIETQCVASKLRIDPSSGSITAVDYKRYADVASGAYTSDSVNGTIVVLAANAIENTVLMLSSGVQNESGQLGRNLMDHPYIAFFGLAPQSVYPFRGPDTTSGLESLRDGAFRAKHASFRASIANWGWSGEPSGSVGLLLKQQTFGKTFRQQLKQRLTRMVKLGVMLEQLPDPDNRVLIDPTKIDRLGNHLPVLTYQYAPYTLDGALMAFDTVWPAVTQAAGITDQTNFPSPAPPGYQQVSYKGRVLNFMGSGHVVGTHRMGASRADSVVDSECCHWQHRNLFAVGPGSMATIGTSNPTLTAVALTFRAAKAMLRTLG